MTTLEHIDELLAAANDTRDIDDVVDLLLDWRHQRAQSWGYRKDTA